MKLPFEALTLALGLSGWAVADRKPLHHVLTPDAML